MKKIDEVVSSPEFLSGAKWARPVSWRGLRMALRANDNPAWLVVAPMPHGGRLWMPLIEELADDWELVEPFDAWAAE